MAGPRAILPQPRATRIFTTPGSGSLSIPTSITCTFAPAWAASTQTPVVPRVIFAAWMAVTAFGEIATPSSHTPWSAHITSSAFFATCGWPPRPGIPAS